MPKIIARTLLVCPLLMLSACNQPQVNDSQATAATQPATETRQTPAGGHPLGAAPADDEYGEFLARSAELVNVPVNDIIKSIRLNAGAMVLGQNVYDKNCAACHGADLKGNKEAHAPDLTDEDWRFSGDELPTGGITKLPSDVEWTVRYGIRSGNPNARGVFVQASETSTGAAHHVEAMGRAISRTDAIFVVDAITGLGTMPLDIDGWGLDVVICGSQKAFMIPPGLAFMSVSPKAWKMGETSTLPHYYFNLKKEKKNGDAGECTEETEVESRPAKSRRDHFTHRRNARDRCHDRAGV